MSSRVYIGHLSSRATEREIGDFFRGYGRIRDIVMKNGFGFVEFDDNRDAEDAIYELNGKDLCGERVIVEMSRRAPRSGGDHRGDYRGGGGQRGYYNDRRERPQRKFTRYGPPVQTRYRLIVENLSTRCSWQDLKDLMRHAGEVTYADAHKKERNVALVCFATHDHLKRAIDKYQGKDINGRRIKLIDDSVGKSRSRSYSRSRSRSPRSRSPRSRSRSQSRSRSASRSRSPVAANGNGRSRSHSEGSRRSRSTSGNRN